MVVLPSFKTYDHNNDSLSEIFPVALSFWGDQQPSTVNLVSSCDWRSQALENLLLSFLKTVYFLSVL